MADWRLAYCYCSKCGRKHDGPVNKESLPEGKRPIRVKGKRYDAFVVVCRRCTVQKAAPKMQASFDQIIDGIVAKATKAHRIDRCISG